MKTIVFVILMVFSCMSFSGGYGKDYGHNTHGNNHGNTTRQKMRNRRHNIQHNHNSGFVSRGHVYRPVYHAPRVIYSYPIIYSVPEYRTYEYNNGFGYEGALGSSIGNAIGGMVYYNKYVR